jgi:hypothetical protein
LHPHQSGEYLLQLPFFRLNSNEYKTVQGEDKAELTKYLFESYLPITKTDGLLSDKIRNTYLAVLAPLKSCEEELTK